MAITISGQNNNDRILASDGVLDSISGFNVVGVMTATQFDVTTKHTANHIDVGSSIQLGNAGIITATTLIGNVTGNVNSTSHLLLQISGSEKFRVGNGGQLGIGGANYGTSGQVLTSGGSGSAPTWSTIASDKITEGNTEAEVVDTGSDGHFKVTTEGTERLRVSADGNLTVGAAVTISPVGNINATGIITATSFSGSGANLTSLPAQATIANNADNRVITGGSGVNLNGEANMRFDGSTLTVDGTTTDTPLMIDTTSNNGAHLRFRKDGSNQHFIGAGGGFSLGDKEDLSLRAYDNLLFATGNSSTEKVRISQTGSLGIGTAAPQVQTHIFGADAELLIERGGYSEAELWLGFPSGQPFIASGPGKGLKLGGNGKWNEGIHIDAGGNMNVTGIVTATAFVPTSQGALSHRNIIVNGAMTISQRGTSVATSGYQTVDRFQFGGAWPGSAITQSQADVGYNSAPYDKGFRKSYKLTNSNQGSTSSSSHIEITYSFEGQEIANSGWDYVSSSKKITLSFWIKSSVAQTFYGYFRTFPGVDMKYSFPIVCSTTDWEFKTVSVVGESNFAENIQNSFPNTTSRAMVLRIVPYYGTTYTSSSAVNNAWQNYSDSTVTPDYATSWFLTNGATFEMTGMQLEVGPVATPFEHRSHGEELRRCQRYFQKDISTRASWNSGNVAGRQFPVRFITEMRDTPTISFSNFQGAGSLSASAASRQGYNAYMSGSERFYEWRHTATAEI